MAPEGCSSLYGEFAYLKKDPKEIKFTVDNAIKKTQKLLSISDAQIITQRIINIPHAYVIYDGWRDKNLPTLLDHLTTYNIHSIGRYGAWKYSSMQEAVLDGKAIAEKITLESINVKMVYTHQSIQKEHL